MNDKIWPTIFRAMILALTWPLALFPRPWLLTLGARGGALIYALWPRRRQIAIENLTDSVAAGRLTLDRPVEVVARESFAHMGRSFMEMIKILHGRHRDILGDLTVEGVESYQAARSQGRGLIMITGHCGNWELSALGLALGLGIRVHVVARAQNSRLLDHLVERMRLGGGNQVIYKDGAVRAILTALKEQDTVGILIDQAVLVREGCLVNFLGRPALTTKLPALLARKTGTPIIPCFIHRDGEGRHHITLGPAVAPSPIPEKETAVVVDMQTLTDRVEEFIRAHPDQWLWGHRRWKRAPGSKDRPPGINL